MTDQEEKPVDKEYGLLVKITCYACREDITHDFDRCNDFSFPNRIYVDLCHKCYQVGMAEMRGTQIGREKRPPCLECGAMTSKEAETMCICNGDKDDCHGCELWPD